tara:strand:- start:183 stop:500 length:318 start_codon:yes stop_codon:yes gene_type:complete
MSDRIYDGDRNTPVDYTVYVITPIKENQNDLRAYIGISRNFWKRLEEHFKNLKGGVVMREIYKDFMTQCEAEIWETFYINEFIKDNYRLTNKVKCPLDKRCESLT